MGQKVLIIGQSGTGKSTSLRNFAKDEVCLIKTINKQLPFRGKFEETYVTDKATDIVKQMKTTDKKVIVIDDGQYTMGNEFFRRALEKGYDKFSDIGKNFFDILSATDELPEDVIVYILLHTEKDTDGNIKIKTIGKMLDEKLTIEGTATIVLMSNVVDGVYTFQTQNSGKDICKSPMGMFKNYLIDNDLKMVDGIIREYYELSDVVVEEKGVAAEKPTRTRRGQVETATAEPVKRERRTRAVEEAAVEVEDSFFESYSGKTKTIVNEEPVKTRRTRAVEAPVEDVITDAVVEVTIDDGLTDEERNAFKAEMEAKNKAYEETLPKRRERTTATAEQTSAESTPVRKTLAEKMAEGGYEAPVRRTRRRD